LVDAVCRDAETAALPDREKALFRFLTKVNDESAHIQRTDVDAARDAGWSDAALYDAITVCAIFNFFNRWIDATGVPDVPRGAYDAAVAAQGGMSYTM
jgi:alkylhydroperoxidase family enzyme